MKICILGPVISDSHFGGVATFDEGLRDGFIEQGHEVLMITNTNTYDKNIEYFSKIDFSFFNKKIIKEIRDFNADMVITSMWYGIVNKSIKKYFPNIKVIQYIHGFPTYRYRIHKRYILNSALKIFRKYSDFFVSNSSFTSCINSEIYGIRCDKTIHIGLKEKFIDFNKKQSENIEFVFAGRLVKEKNVDKVCEIFNFLCEFNQSLKLTIIGEGPEIKNLKEKYESDKVEFVGRKSRKDTLEKLENSDIFISLNPHEPFGLVYLEALIKKCKIICPNTGGQGEFLNGFNEVLQIDINNYKSYKEDFINLINLEGFVNTDLSSFFEYFNYKRVAEELINLK